MLQDAKPNTEAMETKGDMFRERWRTFWWKSYGRFPSPPWYWSSEMTTCSNYSMFLTHKNISYVKMIVLSHWKLKGLSSCSNSNLLPPHTQRVPDLVFQLHLVSFPGHFPQHWPPLPSLSWKLFVWLVFYLSIYLLYILISPLPPFSSPHPFLTNHSLHYPLPFSSERRKPR